MENKLLPCPMCGNQDGYTLSDGSTYRWWNVNCKGCGRMIDECASDRRTSIGTPLPERCESADEAWNEAADYAGKLRQQLAEQKSSKPYMVNSGYTHVVCQCEQCKSSPQVEVLLEALRFYAEPNNWYSLDSGPGGKKIAAIIDEDRTKDFENINGFFLAKGGKKAIDALNAYSAKPKTNFDN
jgi:hypothetical protein